MRNTFKMERIYLAKEEKEVFLHVAKYGKKQPRNITPVTFHYCLSTLEEKGLVEYRINYDEVLDAEVTDKGNVYLEQNPKLKNPVDWKWIILTLLSFITAISTLLALFKN